jgi:phosphoribosylformylglycinamidine synthase
VFKATVRITLRPSILDPQGKAIGHALESLGYGAVEDVRTGKLVELRVAADDAAEAERVAREAAEKLLANPVMEDFTVAVERLDAEPLEPAAA